MSLQKTIHFADFIECCENKKFFAGTLVYFVHIYAGKQKIELFKRIGI